MQITSMKNATMNENWIADLSPKEQEQWYGEVVEYFTDEVVHEVLEKYDNSLDLDLISV
jgi:hypothetical protein